MSARVCGLNQAIYICSYRGPGIQLYIPKIKVILFGSKILPSLVFAKKSVHFENWLCQRDVHNNECKNKKGTREWTCIIMLAFLHLDSLFWK